MIPVNTFGNVLLQLAQDLERAPLIALNALEISTRRSYILALLIYTVYADSRYLSEEQRLPPSAAKLTMFVSAITGSYLSDTISKFLSGLHMWHSMHALRWHGNDAHLQKLVRGTKKIAPS
jgi:hypothetical protein